MSAPAEPPKVSRRIRQYFRALARRRNEKLGPAKVSELARTAARARWNRVRAERAAKAEAEGQALVERAERHIQHSQEHFRNNPPPDHVPKSNSNATAKVHRDLAVGRRYSGEAQTATAAPQVIETPIVENPFPPLPPDRPTAGYKRRRRSGWLS